MALKIKPIKTIKMNKYMYIRYKQESINIVKYSLHFA